MCFFFRQSKEATELKNRFNAKIKDTQHKISALSYNGFEFPQTPVITNIVQDEIQFYNWGLIPDWSNNKDIRKYTLNAKIETLSEKPSFKNYIQNRCLIIADGFYEWQWLDEKGKRKQKYLLTLNEKIFTFAGIWTMWKDNYTNENIFSYTLITTEANEQMSVIHNSKKRMPLILTEDIEKDWLNGKPVEYFQKCDVKLATQMV